MILLDTSFLYAYFEKKDANHKKALDLASQLDNYSTVILPAEVFEELITIITYKASSKKATEIGEMLLDPEGPVKIMQTDPKIFEKTWEKFKKLNPHKFSFIDCLLVTLAEVFKCQVFTFDKEIDKITNYE